MKPSTELFSLIKSLSKSEKRFFKLNSALQAGDKNYLKIFDFIEKQNKYDEEDLKEEDLLDLKWVQDILAKLLIQMPMPHILDQVNHL